MKDNIAEFRKIFGDRILEKKEDLVPYMKDASYFEGNIPMAAVIPKNSEEISKLMKICSREKIQVVMRSGGSALTGSPVPNEDSILISMSAMNRILETHLDDGYIVAEPGLRLDDLNNYLSKLGFFHVLEIGKNSSYLLWYGPDFKICLCYNSQCAFISCH